ncbi:GNAT family N-acetyltransferase [Candidatus Bipolaricaulota bacterium]|nr:GNAT family N-acetyltransferase [Candidatus Bipolaricaulota bacterium]
MNLRRVGRRSQVADESSISFAPLREADLPLLCRWLNNPLVFRWYGGRARTSAELYAKYLPRIRGDEPTRGYIIASRETPIGYIQSYRIADHPDYAAQAALPDDLDPAGVDLFIGEDSFRHQGLGPKILKRFLEKELFASSPVTGCVVCPDPENKAAIRAYHKAGFASVKQIETTEGPELLMRLDRAAFFAEKRSGFLRQGARAALVPYAGALAYLTLRPSYPRAIEATYNALGRGYLHIPAYFILGALVWLSLRRQRHVHQSAIAFAASVAYGTVLELLQAFVPGRTPNGLGVLFDALGAGAAVLGLLIVPRCTRRKPQQDA